MSLRNQSLLPDQYYHIYNRGNGKNKIFLDREDYNRFIKILYICNSENKFIFREFIKKKQIDAFDFERGDPIVSIGAWVLMPNHFHILLISHRQGLWQNNSNPITMYMQKVSTSYVMYFNKKYKRTGSLFEGKFKSKNIFEGNYLQYLFSYIHLNPIKLIQKDWKEKGILNKKESLEFLNTYKYSSFLDYIGNNRKEDKILDKKLFPESFVNIQPNELFGIFSNYNQP